jgi:hypothetical protein
VKLAGFALAFAAGAILIGPLIGRLIGQPAVLSPVSLVQHGLKVGIAAAYLEKPPNVPVPEPIDMVALAIGQAVREQAETLSDCNGALSAAANLADAATKRLLSEMPCALFETWAEQRSSGYAESVQTGFTGIERTSGKTVLRRFVRDGIRQVYVRYSVTVETLPDGTYRVSFGPSLDEAPAQSRKADWTLISLAKYPAPQILRDEDAVRVELYSSGGSRKLVDYVHVGRKDRMILRKDAPYDYYAEDAELSVSRPRIRVNGIARDSIVALPETVRGPVLWVYVPDYGRYILSLHAYPDKGFESAGEAAGNSLTFTAGGNIFRIDTAERVAAGSGTYIVRVLPDLSWMPADPQDRARVMIGTAPGV